MTTINFYNKFIEYMGDDTMDMDTDVFDIILMDVNHTFTAANTLKSDIVANELTTGGGYTAGAKTLNSPTWVESGGVLTFASGIITWTATAGGIGPATDAVIYDETATQVVDALMCSIDFEGSETAGNGTTFVITFDSSGSGTDIFTIT